jgi:hypothetical protein
VTVTHAELTGYGWQAWPAARQLVGSAECCWSDLDGWHVAPLPDDPPLATHVWGWDRDVLWRLRVDGDRAVVAALRPVQAVAGQPVDEPAISERVRVRSTRSRGWPAADQQVRARGSQPSGLEWELAEVTGPRPVTFVRGGLGGGEGGDG